MEWLSAALSAQVASSSRSPSWRSGTWPTRWPPAASPQPFSSSTSAWWPWTGDCAAAVYHIFSLCPLLILLLLKVSGLACVLLEYQLFEPVLIISLNGMEVELLTLYSDHLLLTNNLTLDIFCLTRCFFSSSPAPCSPCTGSGARLTGPSHQPGGLGSLPQETIPRKPFFGEQLFF